MQKAPSEIKVPPSKVIEEDFLIKLASETARIGEEYLKAGRAEEARSLYSKAINRLETWVSKRAKKDRQTKGVEQQILSFKQRSAEIADIYGLLTVVPPRASAEFYVEYIGTANNIPSWQHFPARTDMLNYLDTLGKAKAKAVSSLTISLYGLRISDPFSPDDAVVREELSTIGSVTVVEDDTVGKVLLAIKCGDVDLNEYWCHFCRLHNEDVAHEIQSHLETTIATAYSQANPRAELERRDQSLKRKKRSWTTTDIIEPETIQNDVISIGASQIEQDVSTMPVHQSQPTSKAEDVAAFMALLKQELTGQERLNFATILRDYRSGSITVLDMGNQLLQFLDSDKYHILSDLRHLVAETDQELFSSFLEDVIGDDTISFRSRMSENNPSRRQSLNIMPPAPEDQIIEPLHDINLYDGPRSVSAINQRRGSAVSNRSMTSVKEELGDFDPEKQSNDAECEVISIDITQPSSSDHISISKLPASIPSDGQLSSSPTPPLPKARSTSLKRRKALPPPEALL